MAHAHVTDATNDSMREVTQKFRPIPQWILSVVADIMKPNSDVETGERLSRNANGVQWSVDEATFLGICRRLLMGLWTEPPREEKEAMLVVPCKAGQLKMMQMLWGVKLANRPKIPLW